MFQNEDLAEKLEREGVVKILYAALIDLPILLNESKSKFVFVRGKLKAACLPEELRRYKSLNNCFFCASAKICIYGDWYAGYSRIYGACLVDLLNKLSQQTESKEWIIVNGFSEKTKFDSIRNNFWRDYQRVLLITGLNVLFSLQLVALFASFTIYSDLLLTATVILAFGIVLFFDQFYHATAKGNFFTYGMFHVSGSLVASFFVIILHLCNEIPPILGLCFTVVIAVIWLFAIERCYFLVESPGAIRYYNIRAIQVQRLWFFIVLRLSVITYFLALLLGYFGVGILPARYDVLLRFFIATTFLIVYGIYHITVNNLAGENMLQHWVTKIENLISVELEREKQDKHVPLISIETGIANEPITRSDNDSFSTAVVNESSAILPALGDSAPVHVSRLVAVNKL